MISNTYHYHQSSLNVTSFSMHQHVSHLRSDPIIQHIFYYWCFSLFTEQVFSSLRESNRRRNRVAHIIKGREDPLYNNNQRADSNTPLSQFLWTHSLQNAPTNASLFFIPAKITKFLRAHVTNDDLTRYLLAIQADTDLAIEVHQICW